MLILEGENYTENTIRNVEEIEFFHPKCTTLVIGFANYEAIAWKMGHNRMSTFWTEQTIFGQYRPIDVNFNEKVMNLISIS